MVANRATPSVVPMAIPKPWGEVVGAIVLTAFIVFSVVLAVRNLLSLVALVPSCIWLLFVGLGIWAWCKENGIGGLLTDVLGAYSMRHFAAWVPLDHGPVEIHFGYRLLGATRYYRKVRADRIESVGWHTGQASSLAGRDVGDWSIALWFDHGDPAKSQQRQRWLKPDQEVYIVGPSRRKEDTEALGLQFVGFLRDAGVVLVPGENRCTYVRRTEVKNE